ncbi:acyl-CoA ligase (AMP-forming), exosortase A system-associated [Desulfosarcina alkanivorans]|uniref:Acyl-CoA ligase (AMP-forming), exosortase A system-associated n=1 Tax=Desulfosarcina alkanivorans TaxID=571177 RepID=A0A5K7YE07_9BACT|nr:class I adenylate-forming enzyme family protein [Desulfosarcina alkanivorans]BBO67308.1 acyl-CoA ligase (AMP-forming), exosortase A system-associated [Desulfosarcina alkanivorans]
MENNLIHHFLENSAARHPDKVAIIHEKTRATYRQVNKDSDRLASFLVGRRVEKGDRVVILMENSVEYVTAYYGILKAGAVAVPLGTDLKPDGLIPLLAELEPAAIITSARFERLLQASDLSVPNLDTLIIHNPKFDWDNCGIDVYSFQQTTNHKPQTTNQSNNNWNKNSEFRSQNSESAIQELNKRNEPIQPTTNNPQPTNSNDIELEAVSVSSSDLGSIIYTSGSTGKPKGVMLTHGNIVANTHSICEYLQLTDSDIQMVVLPFFYVMGKSLLNTIVAAGGTLVINNKFAFPATVINQMIEERVTVFSGVPSTYAYLLHRSPLKKSRPRLSHLRMVTQAGGHMARSVKTALRETLPGHTRICIMYGATEASARLTWLDPDRFEQKIDSIGKGIPGVTVKILDDQGFELPQGAKGEVVASGPNIMQGYWRDPAASSQALDGNGYHTGDVGFKDADGFIFLQGRKDNLIKVGGHRINPQEVEDALLATGLAVEASVVGVDDDLLGKRLAALVVPLNGDTSPEAIMENCASMLPKYKMPAELRFVRALPKNANGKVDRNGCLKFFTAESQSTQRGRFFKGYAQKI